MIRLPAAAVAMSAAVLAAAPPSERESSVRFADASREAGLSFQHLNGASPDKHLVETMGSGAVFLDFDNDGWVDVFLVDGGSVVDAAVNRRARHRLYHNRRNGTFEDVTARSGLSHQQYGMGGCAGDFDNDGLVDLYVTNFGPNTLHRNRGNGTFEDVTRAAGVGSPLWSTGCTFVDFDRDGDLDLFVTNYVDAKADRNPFCGDAARHTRFYCHPLSYDPLPNLLYRNDGHASFAEVGGEVGISTYRGNGLGVIAADYDDDGWPDVFVANDSVPNFLFHNEHGTRFEEVGLVSGVAVATDGKPRAGMGVDAADYDGDGRLDFVVTNLDFETESLFRALGNRLFSYATGESGLGVATLPFVGFGVVVFDYDNDDRLDLAIANGHIMDNAPLVRSGATYAQRNLLFHNQDGRRFGEVGLSSGPGFALTKVSRGLASADIDNDGDLDLLVANSGQTADLLRNDGGNRRNALLVRLIGTKSNRDGVGARLRFASGGRTQVREARSGSSYLSQNDSRIHIGLDTATRVDRLEVRWPSGAIEVIRDVAANNIVTIREGQGLVRAEPFAR